MAAFFTSALSYEYYIGFMMISGYSWFRVLRPYSSSKKAETFIHAKLTELSGIRQTFLSEMLLPNMVKRNWVKRLVVLSTIGMSLIGMMPTAQAAEMQIPPVNTDLNDNLRKSIIRVMNGDRFEGSGFYVKGGYVVTNSHIADWVTGTWGYDSEQRKSESALDMDSSLVNLKLVAIDRNKDLALYDTGLQGHEYLNIATSTISSSYRIYGNTYYDAGNPEKTPNGEVFKEKNGIVLLPALYIKTVDHDGNIMSSGYRTLYSFTCLSGNSGSAILNDKDEVVGVSFARTDYGDEKDMALGITLSDLSSFLDENLPATNKTTIEKEVKTPLVVKPMKAAKKTKDRTSRLSVPALQKFKGLSQK
ncbi:serine protease [Paenibacillus sp.]|jgi:hypothetical protein|uniref:S1 family peptidase n=1 Tax=Paenibacillus sp. TaxID=58172 RepID=UPI002836895D|nr:serine protease [Paenibacillus sp.]MDR0268027.1 serine protease [Paenibacillus sp.]